MGTRFLNLLAADVDMSKVTDAQVDAMVNAYAEAANCDKTALKAEVVAHITEYVQAEGLKPPVITAGRSGVISAMRSAARAAVNAAKSELKIKSPSRVFRVEVGVMTMKGFGQGVLTESKAQARIIRNAARYLTDEAKEGAIIHNATTNQKTYNQQSSVNLSGNTFYVRDEQDIRSLAVEIATLTKRQQRGKGLRFA